jgi:hypothetical protein
MASVKFLENSNKLKSLVSTHFPIFHIKKSNQVIKIQEVLPFRIKFVNVGIPGYGPGNVPPIGIAIVGINNYIL